MHCHIAVYGPSEGSGVVSTLGVGEAGVVVGLTTPAAPEPELLCLFSHASKVPIRTKNHSFFMILPILAQAANVWGLTGGAA